MANVYKVIVSKVVDGDTFYGDLVIPDLDFVFTNRKFRLLGVNTPERKQPGYYEATEFTAQYVENKVVPIVVHGTGGFGRLLVDVIIESEGKTLNTLLLENGLAEVYKR